MDEMITTHMVQVNIKDSMAGYLSKMANNVQFQTIEVLAEIYGFNVDDAVKQIGLELEVKLNQAPTGKKTSNKPKTNAPSVLLPWCGEVNNDWCCGLRNNAGLQSQCTMGKMNGGKYCKTCQKQSEKEGNDGKPNYGEVSDRVAGGDDYAGVNGKKPVKFSVVMEKKGISREEAVREAEKLGWTIPETEFEPVSKRMTKKKKNTSVSDTESDTDSDSDTDNIKKRGRPSKKKVVNNDDALSKMVDKVNANESSSESESDNEKKVKKVKKEKKEKKEKKQLTDEEKAIKKEETNRKRKETREKNKALEDKALEDKIDKEIEELVLSDDEGSDDANEETKKKEPKKDTKKKEPKKETKKEEAKEEAKEEEEEESDQDIVECSGDDTINKTIGGKVYLMEKDDDECLYDKESGEFVGTYDEENDAVIMSIGDLDNDSDDE